MSHKVLEQLRSLLEGKTIVKVEAPNAAEAIAKFTMADGSAFRLHATDLGYWIEETIGSKTAGYPSLNALAIDYGHYMHDLTPQYNFNPPPAEMIMEKEWIVFFTPDEKEFRIKLQCLSEVERNIVNHSFACAELCGYLAFGDMWSMPFLPNNADSKVPENCLIKPKEIA
jgi:hypothetical protein